MTDEKIPRSGIKPGGGPKNLKVLLIEDSAADAQLVRTLLQDIEPACELHVVRDGAEALDFLHHRNRFANSPIPRIIVMDWNLPRQNGDELLSAIKSEPELHPIPIIVLSASAVDQEVVRGYELQASCWIVKGSDLDETRHRVHALVDFWARTAQLPNAQGACG